MPSSGRDPVKHFDRSESGSFSVTVAIAMMALVLAMGGAIDLAAFYKAERQLQNSADMAVLAGSALAGATLTERAGEANAFFRMNEKAAGLTTRFWKDGKEYVYSVTGAYTTGLLGLASIKSLPFNVEARSRADDTTLDVALVLDVSGSMAGHRITELKKAVARFLQEFDSNTDLLHVSVVPFNGQTRVDTALRSSSIFSYAQNPYNTFDCHTISDPQDRQTCDKYTIATVEFKECDLLKTTANATDRTLCRPWRDGFQLKANFYRNETYGNYPRDGTTYEYHGFMLNGFRRIDRRTCNGPCGQWTNIFESDKLSWLDEANSIWLDPTLAYNLLRTPSESWSGCVADRTQPHDTSSEAAGTSHATRFPKVRCSDETLKPIQPLSGNLSAVNAFVQNLSPGGPTNVSIGVHWGLHTLTKDAPFTEARDESRKVMIILTDGENTHNR